MKTYIFGHIFQSLFISFFFIKRGEERNSKNEQQPNQSILMKIVRSPINNIVGPGFQLFIISAAQKWEFIMFHHRVRCYRHHLIPNQQQHTKSFPPVLFMAMILHSSCEWLLFLVVSVSRDHHKFNLTRKKKLGKV